MHSLAGQQYNTCNTGNTGGYTHSYKIGVFCIPDGYYGVHFLN